MSETKLEFLGVAKTVRRSLAVPDILLRVWLSPAERDLKISSILTLVKIQLIDSQCQLLLDYGQG